MFEEVKNGLDFKPAEHMLQLVPCEDQKEAHALSNSASPRMDHIERNAGFYPLSSFPTTPKPVQQNREKGWITPYP